MADFTDNKGARTNIFDLVPTVYKSDVNHSLFENAFNRMLTPDDTRRVSGYIGHGNANARVDRQILEPTSHRQAFQLQPTAYTESGDTTSALSFMSFMKQLEMMGVDPDNMNEWGKADRFNWVPPINIDMFVNYQNYYWTGSDELSVPQYLTVENRCAKAQSKIDAYQKLLSQYGSLFSISGIDFKTNSFIVNGLVQPLFSQSFMFYTKGTRDVNLFNKFWTVKTSISQTGNVSNFNCASVDTLVLGQTTITVEQALAINSELPPTVTTVGKWWYKPSTEQLFSWSGTSWIPTSPQFEGSVISLGELLNTFIKEANCICDGDFGWDLALWDDNQAPGEQIWLDRIVNTVAHPSGVAFVEAISHATLSQWVAEWGQPTKLSLWHDTTEDVLKQFTGTEWRIVVNNFSIILGEVVGTAYWDYTAGCDVQEMNQWSSQNKWIHKTQLQTLAGIRRAQAPIIEYNSTMEMSSWVEQEYAWRYRNDVTDAWSPASEPTRLELEPIKNYTIVTGPGDAWTLYLYGSESKQNTCIDYTNTFVPGFKFLIKNDALFRELATTVSSDYRLGVPGDPADVVGYYVTVVTATGSLSKAGTPRSDRLVGAGPDKFRIEPSHTSKGAAWRGYQLHWAVDVNNSTTRPANPQSLNYQLRDGLADSSLSTTTKAENYITTVGPCTQTWTVTAKNLSTLLLDASLRFPMNRGTTYALADSKDARVYLNGIRQYGTYDELTQQYTDEYTAIGTATTFSTPLTAVVGVKFNTTLNINDVVTIDIGPASAVDMGMYAVPVRTELDEQLFTEGVHNKTQPVYMSLTKYKKLEGTKTDVNQYPSFNVYDVVTGAVVKSASVFQYKNGTDSDPINVDLGKRVAMSGSSNYMFEQSLVDTETSRLYGYRDVAKLSNVKYWFSPLRNSVYLWSAPGWTDKIVVDVMVGASISKRVVTPIVSSVEPVSPRVGDAWMDTATVQLNSWSGTDWTIVDGLTVSDADPSISTVWRRGNINNQYIPSRVDSNGNKVDAADPTGEWELPEQWQFNPCHDNRQYVKTTELATHFKSIADAQSTVTGLMGGGAFSRTQQQYNYSLGGTIREYNGSYDTLISAVNVENISPPGLVQWAGDQYSTLLMDVTTTIKNSITGILTTTSVASMLKPQTLLYAKAVDKISYNDFYSIVYDDSTAYESGVGIRNWIMTAGMCGLSGLVQPRINRDASLGVTEVVHHNGHRTQVNVPATEYDRLSLDVIKTSDPRAVGYNMGVLSSTTPPSQVSAIASKFGGLRSNVFWYTVNATERQLYRLMLVSVGSSAPLDEQFVNGTYYYNIQDKTLYVKRAGLWQAATPIGAGDVGPAWQPVSFSEIVASTIVEVEKQLYARALEINANQVSYAPITSSDRAQSLLAVQYAHYTASRNINAPFENVQYVTADAWTWNYSRSVITLPPRTGEVKASACWQSLYQAWFNTPYPHLEPWKLQGYDSEPVWWNEEYADASGQRRWKYNHTTGVGMWSNIMSGFVPHGRSLPSGQKSGPHNDKVPFTYQYVCVNISDTSVSGYASDALYAPYVNMQHVSPNNRTLFVSYSSNIRSPDADYTIGDGSFYEWSWLTSADYVYDRAIVLFKIAPVQFMNSAFGSRQIEVDGLLVDVDTSAVHSHSRTMFHGDVYGEKSVYKANGLNQWYTNFNRFSGFDTNTDFRTAWVQWQPKLTYQFAGIVDTSTFSISSRFFDLVKQDYDITLANIGVIRDVWTDAFNVSVLSIPPAIRQYNNEAMWRFNLAPLAPTARTVHHYDVKNYEFSAISSSSEGTVCRAFSYVINNASPGSKRLWIEGNRTKDLSIGNSIEISGSDAANGVYTVVSVVYEPMTDLTRIGVKEFLATSSTLGRVSLLNKQLPWVTGDAVYFTSAKLLPDQIEQNQMYFFIKLDAATFMIANTAADALNRVGIVISGYDGALSVGERVSTFRAGNSTLWYHYALDFATIKQTVIPATVSGMQQLINLIDGYTAWQTDTQLQTFNVPVESGFDPVTGRITNWQLEMERLIEWAYSLRSTRMQMNDKFEISVKNLSDNTFKFTDSIPNWQPAEAVSLGTSGSLPQPLRSGVTYYFVPTDQRDTFRLSYTQDIASVTAIVDVSTMGGGNSYAGLYQPQVSFPTFELNPSRNNIWLDTPQGVLSNVIDGPYPDIKVQQTVFDQYGRPLDSSQIQVYRQDRRSRISVIPQLYNDVDPQPADPQLADPYNYLHLGGGHFFIEGYEHYLILNDYTVSGSLIYDPFLGLNIKKLDVDYYESADFTLRPTIGGYYLLKGQFHRNMEGSVLDLQHGYDTHAVSDNNPIADKARELVGYPGKSDYLNVLNANDATQFKFYQGMIQTKGSLNSVNAYINSRRFLDAKVDEFWAWKVAEFGDVRPKVYPEIKLLDSDVDKTTIRLMFMSPLDDTDSPEYVTAINNGFEMVTFDEEGKRWTDYPEQKTLLRDSPLFFDAEASSLVRILVTDKTAQGPTRPKLLVNGTDVDVWYNTSDNYRAYVFDPQTAQWVTFSPAPSSDSSLQALARDYSDRLGVDDANKVVMFRVSPSCDDVRIIRRIPADTDMNNYSSMILTQGTGGDQYSMVNSEVVSLTEGTFTGLLLLFTINAAADAINPSKLVDATAQVSTATLPLWDPARGRHYWIADHNIDNKSVVDPARYSSTINPSLATNPSWNFMEVGTTWLDGSTLAYVPYYDAWVTPDINNRIHSWGKLADWGKVSVYQWVESPVPPEEWANVVEQQATNANIPVNSKKTGSVRKAMFRRTRKATECSITLTSTGRFLEGDEVTISGSILSGGSFTTGDLVKVVVPTGITGNQPLGTYTVSATDSGFTVANNEFDVNAQLVLSHTTVATAADVTSGFVTRQVAVTVVPVFESTDWQEVDTISERFIPVIDRYSTAARVVMNASSMTLKLSNTGWEIGEQVSVYVNGKTLIASTHVDAGNTVSCPVTVDNCFVDVVRTKKQLSDEERVFDPDISDDGTALEQWKEFTPSTKYTYELNGQTYTKWYFWAEKVTTRRHASDPSSLAPVLVESSLVNIPSPYMIVMHPKDDTVLASKYGWGTSPWGVNFSNSPQADGYAFNPVFYRQVVLCKLTDYVTSGSRYKVRFTRDLTLRDQTSMSLTSLNKKNKHDEWMLIRQYQPTNIPRTLWDAVTESMIGYKLTDRSIKVPSLNRELYDTANETTTRYGLGSDQAFVDGRLATATIVNYLTSPDVDFYPVDINTFFSEHSFDTPKAIEAAMNAIYNTFGSIHVNTIWFTVLLDALSVKPKYKELMKTSWVAIYGIRILESGGIFDE